PQEARAARAHVQRPDGIRQHPRGRSPQPAGAEGPRPRPAGRVPGAPRRRPVPDTVAESLVQRVAARVVQARLGAEPVPRRGQRGPLGPLTPFHEPPPRLTPTVRACFHGAPEGRRWIAGAPMSLSDEVVAKVDRDELVELALRLCNIDSAGPHEAAAAEYVYEWLRAEGFTARKTGLLADRFNLIGRLPGTGGGYSLLFNS